MKAVCCVIEWCVCLAEIEAQHCRVHRIDANISPEPIDADAVLFDVYPAGARGDFPLVTHGITITLTEDHAEALAGGYVPRVVKSVLRELLDWDLEIQRAADRPAPKGRKAK